MLNSMLLLRLPDTSPHLIFCPAQGSTEEAAVDQFRQMLRVLGSDGQVDVDEQPLVGPLELVPLLLRQTLAGRVTEDLAECQLPEHSPEWETYESCIWSLRRRLLNEDLRAILQMQADELSFVSIRRLVKTRPELRSAYADDYLAEFISDAHRDGGRGATHAAYYLSELRLLLRQVRDKGIDVAFADYENDVRAGRRGPVAAAKALGLKPP